MVVRKPIVDVNFKTDTAVDEDLVEFLKQQIDRGIPQNELKDPQGKTVRRLRCVVKAGRGILSPDNVTQLKEQTYKSNKEYKNYYYTNSGDNYMFGFYENENGRKIVSINLFEATQLSMNLNQDTQRELFKSVEPVYISKGKKESIAELKHIFMPGQKVLFFFESKEELKDLDKEELSRRLYYVKRLYQASVGNIQFQHHLEARDDSGISEEFGVSGKNGFSLDKLTKSFSPPRILFTPSKDAFIIENKDFIFNLDGSIDFKF